MKNDRARGRLRKNEEKDVGLRHSIGHWFKPALDRLGRSAVPSKQNTHRQAAFKIMYERFREILALNDSSLELIADIEDVIGSARHFSLGALEHRIRKAAMDVFVMVKDINQIADNRYPALYESLQKISRELEMEMAPAHEANHGRHVIPLAEIRATDAPLVGLKMANLGEVGAECGFVIPGGFAITTAAFLDFMTNGPLWDKCEELDLYLETGDAQKFNEACREIQAAILAAPVAAEIAAAIHHAFQEHFRDAGTLVAMRSSAVGEDAAEASHAGLYHTELNTDSSRLLDAYRSVLASAFSPIAASYRFKRGIAIADSLMAVGCVRMIQPRYAGVLFSRLPDLLEADAILISTVQGIALGLVAGSETAETLVITSGRTSSVCETLLNQSEIAALINAARRLEHHFGRPQDIEWAIDSEGVLNILQARPMTAVQIETEAPESVITDQPSILEGGFVACPGVASGPVVTLGPDDDLSHFPEGGILVARHSKPIYAQVFDRCSAVITDVGSPTGHMSSLAREFEVPTIVGMEGATRMLHDGQCVTVDAGACRVFSGIIPHDAKPRRAQKNPDSPGLERLRHMARFLTPLTMTDPESADFHPDSCRSLHDITRYVHEKAFEVMFHYGDVATVNGDSSVRLEAKLPIIVEVFDVGGGISPDIILKTRIRPEHIVSVPMRAFLEGLLEPRIRWDLPRPVSMRGFLSVLGESVAGHPAYTSEIGRLSYAIISDRYMNFSTKAGYHFSTVDTYCGRSVNKNYVHFRFSGGAAVEERRRRRIRFLSAVVSALDFIVQIKGDTLIASLDKYCAEDIHPRLVSLGRLTLCARQLDMLMDSDFSPEIFARAFLAGEWHKF